MPFVKPRRLYLSLAPVAARLLLGAVLPSEELLHSAAASMLYSTILNLVSLVHSVHLLPDLQQG